MTTCNPTISASGPPQERRGNYKTPVRLGGQGNPLIIDTLSHQVRAVHAADHYSCPIYGRNTDMRALNLERCAKIASFNIESKGKL